MGTTICFPDISLRQRLADAGLREFDDFLRGGELERERAASTLRTLSLSDAGRQLLIYIKAHDYSGQALWRRFGAEKAAREAANYRVMSGCGIGVPEVVCIGIRRIRGLLQQGFLATRQIPDSMNLEQWFAAHARMHEPGRPRADHRIGRVLRESARIISHMHGRGFYHLDLQWRNIMVSPVSEEAPSIFLLDSTRGGRRWWPPSRHYGRLRDLSCLYKDARRFLSRSHMLRWMLGYLGVRRLGPREKLMIWTILRDRSGKDRPAE